MQAVRHNVERTCEHLAAADINGVSGSCKNMLAHRDSLLTFVGRTDVGRVWHKRCFGAQSARRHKFAERVMTVGHTLRRTRKGVFADIIAVYVIAAYDAFIANIAPSPLLGAPDTS